MSPGKLRARTDRHNNPAAFTTDVAKNGGLVEGVDYSVGDPFHIGPATYYTARLLGDPIAITIKLIDKATYYTKNGGIRWIYIAIPPDIWKSMSYEQKKMAIKFHYKNEGGEELKKLFV